MAVEKQGAPEAVSDQRKLLLDGAVVGAVGFVETPLQLVLPHPLAPQGPMSCRSRWNDPQASAGARAGPGPALHMDQHGVDLVFGPVAVDRCSRCQGNHSADSACEGPPRQPVDQGILERPEGPVPVPRKLDEPRRILAPRVRNRQQHGQIAAQRVDDWLRKSSHNLSQIRTDIERLQRSAASFASGKSRFISA